MSQRMGYRLSYGRPEPRTSWPQRTVQDAGISAIGGSGARAEAKTKS
jgi:hypothetical protein